MPKTKPVDDDDAYAVPLSFDSPESSTIAGATYDPEQRKLVVSFRSIRGAEPRTYVYDGVDEALWAEFVMAESKGHCFSARIRPMFSGRMV